MKVFNLILVVDLLIFVTVPVIQAKSCNITAEELIKRDAQTHEINLACGGFLDPRCGAE